MTNISIKEFDNRKHREQVAGLWKRIFDYQAPHNDPELVVDKKIEFGDGLFFVALDGDRVIGTIMAGYDGHRGWIYSMAVSPEYREKGIGSRLLSHAEKILSNLGCLKINLQIMEDNSGVERFYASQGYSTENRISMGKRLSKNIEKIKN
jgi:ribosomal protein S18 acetylase RimI-like enzyme